MIKKIFLVVTLLLSINLNASDMDDAKEACSNDNPLACTHVGIGYVEGIGIEKNATKAIEFLYKGCHGGDAKGCSAFGYLLIQGMGIEKDIDKGLKLFELACESKEYTSCNNLGSIFIIGQNGVKKDILKGMSFYHKACLGGLAESCSAYGFMLLGNNGIERNEKSAKIYLKKGCDGGDTVACKQLLTISGERNNVSSLPLWAIITILIGILVIIFLIVKLVGINKIKESMFGVLAIIGVLLFWLGSTWLETWWTAFRLNFFGF